MLSLKLTGDKRAHPGRKTRLQTRFPHAHLLLPKTPRERRGSPPQIAQLSNLPTRAFFRLSKDPAVFRNRRRKLLVSVSDLQTENNHRRGLEVNVCVFFFFLENSDSSASDNFVQAFLLAPERALREEEGRHKAIQTDKEE